MYVRTGGLYGAAPAAGGLGLGDFTAAPPADPGQLLTDTVAQAKDRFSTVAVFGVAMLAGVGWLLSRSGRR